MFGFSKRKTPLEPWMASLCKWADEVGLEELRWEVQSRNRDGGFWVGFPRDPEKMLKLEGLNIQKMGLTELPNEIGNLTNLKKIWARENNLTHLPDGIGNLEQLEELDLEGNQISVLPDWISNLKRLRDLDLRSNRLRYVPVSIRNLRSLEKLDLRDQPIDLGDAETPLTDDQVQAIFSHGDVLRC